MWDGWANAPRGAPHKHVRRMEKAWQELPQDDARARRGQSSC